MSLRGVKSLRLLPAGPSGSRRTSLRAIGEQFFPPDRGAVKSLAGSQPTDPRRSHSEIFFRCTEFFEGWIRSAGSVAVAPSKICESDQYLPREGRRDDSLEPSAAGISEPLFFSSTSPARGRGAVRSLAGRSPRDRVGATHAKNPMRARGLISSPISKESNAPRSPGVAIDPSRLSLPPAGKKRRVIRGGGGVLPPPLPCPCPLHNPTGPSP